MYKIDFETKEHNGILEETCIRSTHGTLNDVVEYLIANKHRFNDYEEFKLYYESRATDVYTK